MRTCSHCDRHIEFVDGVWIDPNATGDDAIWRETCDASEMFTAEHEPSDRKDCGECGRQLWTFRDAFTACGVCDLMLGCPGEPWEIVPRPYDWELDSD